MNNTIIYHPREAQRLEALRSLQLLDTPIEERYERLTRMGQRMFSVPICAISCMDHRRQWFKSIQGMNTERTDRSVSFCRHAIAKEEPLLVPDARRDPRFAQNPMVSGEPGIVFYAAVPIYSSDNLPIASFCIVDFVPRALGQGEMRALADFARTAQDLVQSPLPNPIERQLGTMIGESWRHTLIEPCTRLWNNEGVSMIAEIALNNAHHDAQNACIAMIELPRYTQINSALGHAGGDRVLRRLARSMLSELDTQDSIGLADRDQFVVVMNHVRDAKDAQDRIARFQKAAESFQIEGIEGRPLMGARTSAAYIPAGSPARGEHLFDRLRDALRDPDAQPASAVRFIEPAETHRAPQEQVA